MIRRLAAQLCERLKQHGHGAIRIVSRIHLAQDNDPDPEQVVSDSKDNPIEEQSVRKDCWVFSLGLYRATSDAGHIIPLLLYQLDQQVWSYKASVSGICLEASLTGVLRWKQTELFQSDIQQHHQNLSQLMDLLSCRVGKEKHRWSKNTIASSTRACMYLATFDWSEMEECRFH